MGLEHWLFTIPLRLRSLFRWTQADQELDDELRDHFERKIEEYVAQGMTQQEAHRRARLDLDGIEQTKEKCRDARGVNWIQGFVQDLHYGFRTLGKSPGFTTVAVLTLALGIGANTAIFSVVDAVLFRALPYRDPGQLVWATNYVPAQRQNLAFADEYAGWRTQNHVFQNIAAYSTSAEYTLTGARTPQRLRGGQVTASFLDVLGLMPQLGRNFLPEEDRPAGPKVVLLSDATWRADFGADPGVIGRVVALDDTPYTIVGVLPRNFEFLDNNPADLLVPFQLADSSIQASGGQIRVQIQPLSVVARLTRGATLAAVAKELGTINDRVLSSLPGNMKRLMGESQAQAFFLHDHEVGNVRPALLVLFGAVGFVLLIACANVANLQLARAAGREKEVAIRGALGAGSWRLARLFLTESSVVALAGGGAGLSLAAWAIRLIHEFAPQNTPHLQDARLDMRVLVLTLALSLLTGILFGLAPVMAAFRISVDKTLKETGGRSGTGAGTRRAQRVLMVAEIALAIVLFISAGLLVKSLLRLTAVNTGFDSHGVLTARIALPLDEYSSLDQQRSFFQDLTEKLQAIPGVEAAGATASIPLRGNPMISSIQIEGQPLADFGTPDFPASSINSVSPGYFAALHVPLIEGRLLDERDGPDAPNVVVVNQAFVRRFFPKEDPIGKRFTAGMRPGMRAGTADSGAVPTWTIVGVIGDTKQRGLASETVPEVTASLLQWPRFMMYFTLRTSLDALSLVPAVRERVRELDKNLPVYSVQTMDEVLSAEVASQRFNAGALAGFAALAVLLAAVGVYSVMAYAVGQRTHEIGVRMALGAGRRTVLRMVLNEGLRLALVGVVLGVAAAFALTRLMTSLLFGVKASDPATFLVVTIALIGVALGACWIPAYRATRVDPMVALRYE